MKKDRLILDALRYLEQTLPIGSFEILDNWEADLLAIGVTNPRNPGALAYISVTDSVHYTIIIEAKTGGDISGDIASFECATLDDMARIVGDMAAINAPGG